MATHPRSSNSGCRVEQLYDRCEAVLGVLPVDTAATQSEVDAIAPFLDAITPADLRINPPGRTDNALGRLLGGGGGRPSNGQYLPLEYLRLHDSALFTMGVFCFPEHGVIPLHDHPGMTVVSKLVYGRVRVRSFDWVEADGNGSDEMTSHYDGNIKKSLPRLARLVADRETQAPTAPLALFPHNANVHTFHAITPCALLDVLSPPYAVGGGRDCHYFKEVKCGPNGEACGEGEAWLLEITCPDTFMVNRGTYKGPRVGSEAR